MTEVWFYHLERASVEQVLPELLEKTVSRGWRAYVHAGAASGHQDDMIRMLDERLWTYAPAGFLAHGREGGEADVLQPVLLGTSGAPANSPQVLISVVPGDLPDVEGLQRCLIVFEGGDADHLSWARTQWTRLKAEGHQLAYWQQNEDGRWEKKS